MNVQTFAEIKEQRQGNSGTVPASLLCFKGHNTTVYLSNRSTHTRPLKDVYGVMPSVHLNSHQLGNHQEFHKLQDILTHCLGLYSKLVIIPNVCQMALRMRATSNG